MSANVPERIPPSAGFAIEPERYELTESPAYTFEPTRRDLFKMLGGGLLVLCLLGCSSPDATAQQEAGGGRRPGGQGAGGESGGFRGGQGAPRDIGAWLHIGEDGTVTAFTGKVEVGQNARTALSMAVAEELHCPLSSVRMVMGDTDLTPFDMGTFGSRTTPTMNPQLRRAAVAAREALLDIAAEQMKSPKGELVVADGKIVHSASRQSSGFGELAKGRKLVKMISDDMPLTPATEWTVCGKPTHKVNGRDIVTGKHAYSSDTVRPGMLYGKVIRPAAYGATLASADTSQTEKMPGVTVVRDGNFLGVVAPSTHRAAEAADAIRAEWKTTPQPSEKELFDLLKRTATGGDRGDYSSGSMEDGLKAARHTVKQSYQVAYIAHTPLEPRAAVAEWGADGRLTVWTGTQRPFGVRGELAQAFGIPEDRVRVIMPDTGSGYGGKHTGEAAIEAARMAKAAGKPVKLVWTREEEFTWAYFRPAGLIEITSGVTGDGTITAWEFHNYNSGNAGIRPVYAIPNQKIQFHGAESPLRQGSYRALAATANHFARETHINEMAHTVGMDPLAFRLKNVTDERFKAVLQTAADRFGWGKGKPAAGRGYGIAAGFDKGGYVANCVEIEAARGNVRLLRVTTVFECGAIVNPDQLRNQIEGGVIQGIGGALFEAIHFENGKITNPRLSEYRVPRFRDIPAMDTHLIDRKDLPSAGAGESPLIALAPAIGAAIFDATSVRLRALPLAPNGLPKATT